MKIIFFGADRWFSSAVLGALVAAGHNVPIVVTKGDTIGKFKVQNSKFKVIHAKTAEDISKKRLEATLDEIATPRSVDMNVARNDRFAVNDSRFTNDNRPDAIVLASFGPPFLGNDVLNWPKYGCLNVHASLLPRWRGASPVFAAIAAGDKETGVSIMRMTEEIDRGPVLGQRKLKIRQPIFPSSRASDSESRDPATAGSDLGRFARSLDSPAFGGVARDDEEMPDTRETLTKRLGLLGGELIVEALKKLETGQITEVIQPEKSPTSYTRRLTKQSGRIDWSQSPIETCPERSRRIERFIRAAFPWPSAMSNVKFKMKNSKWQTIQNIKILKAHLERSSQRDCHGRLRRPRNDVTLVIDFLQLPGKNPVSWKQFLAGHTDVKFK